ncbi:translation initiation factor IF-2 [Pilibacter termitis]|uniref:Translation initiation factor IF-2 n=1 Tax=Pilibacter termitis TaxID=263852 RepID=A0A1T4KNZ6_9ENTE|nr:translation initiation factor IF-2 [Pilibacter termitis]SJZ44140.1 translation initiation factor IF-2 [Pilibacter termitis]
MSKKRIYEIAKEMNQASKDVVEAAHKLGIDVKSHSSTVDSSEEAKIKSSFSPKPAPKKVEQKPMRKEEKQLNQQTKPKPAAPHSQGKEQGVRENRKPQGDSRQGGGEKRNFERRDRNPNAQQGERRNDGQGRTQQGERRNDRPRRDQQGQGDRRTNQQGGNRQGGYNGNRPQGQGGTQGRTQQGERRNDGQARTQQGERRNDRPRRDQQGQGDRRTNQQGGNRQGGYNSNRPQAQGGGGRFNNNRPQGNGNRPQGGGNAPREARKSDVPVVETKDSRTNRRRDNRSNDRTNDKGGRWDDNRNSNFKGRKAKKGKKGQHQQVQKPAPPARKFHELPEVFVYSDGMTVAEMAKKIKREPAEIVKKLFLMGIMATQNQSLDKDTLELLAIDYGMKSEEKIEVDIADIDKFFEPEAVDPDKLTERPPVVTIMGHVDHGKTTLLDTLRKSSVTSGEAGGITQHIGAYQINVHGKPITFLDTPGHAAFTSMRARGASITDITILVVAADDGVMPQTVEAINHAKAAGVPIIVAVNKIDKPGANPDRVIQELSEYELIPEAWGGDTIFVNISAKFGQNIEELLENILLVAEVEELKADPTMRAIGTVIEARLDKGKGTVATLLVQQGTLRVQDPIVVGDTFGRVRTMVNDRGRRDKTAGPATPVEITGLNDVPQAGDHFVVFEDEKSARQAGEERAKRAVMEQRKVASHVSLENLFDTLKDGEIKDVNVIIKADVQGSAEALSASLQKIEVEGVRVKIVHSAVGAINESDVTLAEASNAIIIGFNTRPTPQAKQQAETDEVDIRLHRIIYKVIEEIEDAMKGMLDPEFEEKITGEAQIRETFKVSKVGTIGGFYVINGYIQRNSGVRVIRDGVVIYEGNLASLKHFKDDVKEVKKGFEGGLMIENFNDLKVDDVVEGFVMEEIKRKD